MTKIDAKSLIAQATESEIVEMFRECGFSELEKPSSSDGWIGSVRGPSVLGEGRNPNFSVNVHTGRVKDHGGSNYSGDLFDVVKDVMGVGFRESLAWVSKRVASAAPLRIAPDREPPRTPATGLKPATPADLQSWTSQLHDEESSEAKKARNYLVAIRGLKPASLKTAQVGMRQFRGALWIVFPYNPRAKGHSGYKMFAFDPDREDWALDESGRKKTLSNGKATRYAALDAFACSPGTNTTLWCEGEIDSLLLAQLGFRVACDTAGAGTIPEETLNWIQESGSPVCLIFDNDPAGSKGAEKRAAKLQARGIAVRIAQIPGVRGRDVSDVILEDGVDSLGELLEGARPASPPPPSHSVGDEGGRRIAPISARELCASVGEEPDLLAPYVVRGAVTLLSGLMKEAGKTTWLLALAKAVATGAEFLGARLTKGRVLYLTEQPDASMSAMLRSAGLGECDNLHIYTRRICSMAKYYDLMDEVVARCQEEKIDLVIIDTLGQVSVMKEENDASEAAYVMRPVKDVADQGAAVVVSAHDRKSGGSVIERVRGSGNLVGQADTILGLSRRAGLRERARLIEAIGRFDFPESATIELSEGGVYELGDGVPVAAKPKLEEIILELLTGREADPLTRLEIQELLEGQVSEKQLERRLLKMTNAELILRRSGAGSGSPYEYWRHGSPPLTDNTTVLPGEGKERVPSEPWQGRPDRPPALLQQPSHQQRPSSSAPPSVDETGHTPALP